MSTSFRNLFRLGDVQHIEIPIIQRDYAHGRQDGGVPRIRRAFLRVLHGALTGGEPVGLDFVYGEVRNKRMIPLDGQQRLTTLFLLHWYLAARSKRAGADCEFLEKFTYETRYSARHFCEKLVAQRPPFPRDTLPSAWIGDQHWYAGAWKHDPTIQSMLVVLDDIHDLFRDANEEACLDAWQRLVAKDVPAIAFESLSLSAMGLTDELYIKMNSRGKPLTPFEHFKANFEQTLREVSEAHPEALRGNETPYQEFIRKVDQDWSDLLWPLRDSHNKDDSDDIIDDEFLRLFRFLTEVVIHRQGLPVDPGLVDNDIDLWAERVYGKANANDPVAAQRYLFDALDCLFGEFGNVKTANEITDWFGIRFTKRGHLSGAVAIFGEVDLFGACCAKYGTMEGRNRAFSLSLTLLLFAVIEYLMTDPRPQPEDCARRLRVLRNLVFASDNEIRLDKLSTLLDETSKYIRNGDLAVLATYNKRQIDAEKGKAELSAWYAADHRLQEIVWRLEDHDLLRGCLAAFDLGGDAATFKRRAELFHEVFTEDGDPPYREISAALLACGDYSRRASERASEVRYQCGSAGLKQQSVWRQLLASPGGADFGKTKAVLLKMLDTLAATAGASIPARLQAIADGYLALQEEARRFDWRYYLTRYSTMRAGSSGLYISSSRAMGFDLCMMERARLNSYYCDPYLAAVIEQSGAKVGQDVAQLRHYGWDGYPPEGRWIRLARTMEDLMSCRNDGFQVQVSSQAAFKAICEEHGVGGDGLLRVPQVVFDGVTYDMEDRILAGAKLLQALIANQRPSASASPPNAGPMVVKRDVYLLAEMPGDGIKVFGKKPEVGGLDVVVVQREGGPTFPDYADRIGRFMPYMQWRETALKLAPEDVPAEFTASSFELPPEEM